MEETVEFDLLFTQAAGGKPDAEAVRRCGDWLRRKGVKAYDSGRGLACKAPRPLIERLFGTALEPTSGSAGTPPYRFATPPRLPDALRACVAQVTITAKPEFF